MPAFQDIILKFCSILCEYVNRIKALLDWLGDSARVALQKSHSTGAAASVMDAAADRYHTTSRVSSASLPTPAVVHVHVVAAVLWKSCEYADRYNVKEIITKELLRLVCVKL
jgi:hypothetical protein